MTSGDFLLLAPVGLLVLATILALLLEAAGTPVGARKRGSRAHIAVISLLTCVAAAIFVSLYWRGLTLGPQLAHVVVIDLVSEKAAIAVLVVGFLSVAAAVPTLREVDEERGDTFALILLATAALVVLVIAKEVLLIATASTLFGIALTALCAVDRQAPHSAEAAVKGVVLSATSVALLGFGGALIFGATGTTDLFIAGQAASNAMPLAIAGVVLVAVALLSTLPIVPLHLSRVDLLHGAPSFATLLLGAQGLIGGGVLCSRLAARLPTVAELPSPTLHTAAFVIAAASIAIPAVAANDQKQVARMCAWLLAGQGGLLWVTLIVGKGVHGANGPLLLVVIVPATIAAAGALVGAAVIEPRGASGATWEDWSGVGRAHPVVAVALLWLLASLAGVPGTVGFFARVEIAKAAFSSHQTELGVLVIASFVFSTAPVLRLTLFLFGKRRGQRLRKGQGSAWRAVILGATAMAIAGAGVLPAVVLPWLFAG